MNTSTTFSKIQKKPGSTKLSIEVSRDGKPFGLIWSWPDTRTECHPWHAKTVAGAHTCVWGDHDGAGTKTAAKEVMMQWMIARPDLTVEEQAAYDKLVGA